MDKPERARAILRGIEQYDSTYGRDIPSRYAWTDTIRQIMFGKFDIRVIRDSRIDLGHIGGGQIGEHVVHQDGSLVVAVSVHGDRRFAANFVGDQVTLHHFQPGIWETTFGSDPGADTTAILPAVFENDKDPLWRRLKAECEGALKQLKLGSSGPGSPTLRPSC